MTLNEYQKDALRTAPELGDINLLGLDPTDEIDAQVIKGIEIAQKKSDLTHAAMGLCTEAGELMDVLKKHDYYGKPVDWVNVVEEIGDLAWYLALACRATSVSFEETCAKNIAKLKARYPDKFAQEAALNRNLEAERAVLGGTNSPPTVDTGTGINHPV